MAALPGTRRLTVAAALGALLVGALRGRLARFAIENESMLPALHRGDYVVARLTNKVERGDIVVYPDPADNDRHLVKRVVGLAGEQVVADLGHVAIDGEVLAEPWADGPTFPDGTWSNPPGTAFLLGDNRAASSGDSRATGPVRIEGVHKVVFRYWPPSRIGRT